MKFYEYGDKSLPHVMLIHGAGWSYWLYLRQARLLQDKYHVILPIIDGHGEEWGTSYISTENTADKIIDYIDRNCNGKLFALSGVSLGGQTVIEILSRRSNIAEKAIVESGLCIPQSFLLKYSVFTYNVFSKILFSNSFNKIALNMLPKRFEITEEIKDLYLRDMCSVKKDTMINVFETYYKYSLKESLKNSNVDTMYWYGSKEMKCIKESAKEFKSYMKKCKVVKFNGYTHAEISSYHPDEWVERAEKFLINMK